MPADAVTPIASDPPFGKRSEVAASIVGHMTLVPIPNSRAANMPADGLAAWLRRKRPASAKSDPKKRIPLDPKMR
ncbi:hypothetical protein D3C80_1253430 [compost metagenome]